MKIVSFETFPLSIPYKHAEISSRVRRGGVSDVVVKLTTDSGLIGWGESCCGADTSSIVAALESMKPFVIGRDPWDLEGIARSVYGTGCWNYRIMTGNMAFAGIDMALWDICGKSAGQPIYRLFGGAMRETVEYFQYLAWGKPEDVAAQCREGRQLGYKHYYLKVGIDSKAEEAMLEAIRDTVGEDAKIRIDANEAWTVPEAVTLLNRWHQRFRIDFAEAPVKAFPISLTKELRNRVPVALCANEGLERETDALSVILSGAVDVLCFSSYWVGSLRRMHTLSQLAALQGIGVVKHTHGEFGIAAAAGQHMMLTLPNVVGGVQQTASVMSDDVLTEALPICSGPSWGLIERPGLGIEVSEAKLEQYHEAFKRNGQFLPYGEL